MKFFRKILINLFKEKEYIAGKFNENIAERKRFHFLSLVLYIQGCSLCSHQSLKRPPDCRSIMQFKAGIMMSNRDTWRSKYTYIHLSPFLSPSSYPYIYIYIYITTHLKIN